MSVMTLGTFSRYPSVYLVTGYILLIVTAKTDLPRFRNQQKGEPGAMGIMAYLTSAGGDGTVYIFLVSLDDMAVITEFLNLQYQDVRPSLVACDAELRGIRSVLLICRSSHGQIGVCCALQLHIFFVRIRHPVKKETQHLITCPGCAPIK